MSALEARVTQMPRYTLSTHEAAEALGVSHGCVLNLIGERQLDSFLMNNTRVVSIRALEDCVRRLETEQNPHLTKATPKRGSKARGAVP